MFVIQMPNGRYVKKHGGMNDFVADPHDASTYPSKEAAEAGKVGHHYDMGGSGFKGAIVSYTSACRNYVSPMAKYWEHYR